MTRFLLLPPPPPETQLPRLPPQTPPHRDPKEPRIPVPLLLAPQSWMVGFPEETVAWAVATAGFAGCTHVEQTALLHSQFSGFLGTNVVSLLRLSFPI